MKILVVCQYYYPEPFKINEICEEFVKRGNEVTVITGLPNYPKGKIYKGYRFFKRRNENINGVDVIRTFEIGRRKGIIFRALNYFSFMISASIKTFFMKEKFDVIYVYQLSPITMVKPAITYKKKNNTKMVLYCLDLWPESIKAFGITERSKIYKFIDKYSKKIYESTDKILVSSNNFRGNFNNKPTEYVPQYSEDILKKKTSTKSEKMNFVFAGNVGKAQSMETIVKAAKELINEKDILIHIVGDGSELENTKQMAKSYKLENLIFHGRKNIEEMQKYYDMADAMLVTLGKDDFLSKTLPAKVQACMSTGNAIVAAADGEIKTVIEDANCGYCTPAEDYMALAEQIRHFSKLNVAEKEKLRSNAYEYYNNYFNKDNFIKKTLTNLKEKIENV